MGKILAGVDLAPHQKKAIGEMKDGCILQGGVGSGKSRAALAYYMLTEEHEDVYVITTAKKRDSMDWETEASRFGIGWDREATIAGVLTVDSWNNIEKYKDVENAFFIFDEQRLVGAGKWSKTFLKIAKKNRWILLSATPGDNWMDYIPVFIANGFYRNRTEFKAQHVIFKPFRSYPVVERYVDVNRLVRHRNSILIHMPYARQTIRNPVTLWCEYDKEAMARISHGRWNFYEDRPIDNVAEMFLLMRRVANSDPSRKQKVLELIDRHPRLIIFYNFNYELDIIRALTGWDERGIAFAEWNGHKHQEIPTTPRWVYAVQYVAGSEGWNCTTTDSTVFWSLPYSYKIWEQAHGRTDRMNTPFVDLYYYILRSKAIIDFAIWRSLMSKQDFQVSHFELDDAEFADMSYQVREGQESGEKHGH